MKKPAIFSFFSGAGFLDLGFEMSGFDIVFVNEYHEPFLNTYKYSRENLGIKKPEFDYHLGDISEYVSEQGEKKLRNIVKKCRTREQRIGFIGGPPCPDFSVGGKNRGFEGENGKLTATYVELICKQEPDFFVLENVKGLWRTKKHRAFYDQMKVKLSEHGYVTTERLINAIEYGVPQHRERIILFGIKENYLKELGFELNLFETLDKVFPWEAKIKFPMEKIKSVPFPSQDQFAEDQLLEMPEGIPEELTVEYWFHKNDVYNHPNSHMYFTPKAGLAKFLVIPEGDDSKKSYKRLHRWRYSPTAAYGNNEVHLHPYKARRLSVAEALAIQSLPKKFKLPADITLSNAFKTVGNGVPYLASKGIAETIIEFIKG